MTVVLWTVNPNQNAEMTCYLTLNILYAYKYIQCLWKKISFHFVCVVKHANLTLFIKVIEVNFLLKLGWIQNLSPLTYHLFLIAGVFSCEFNK